MDTLNRDILCYLAENYLNISDASNLAKTSKCTHFKPTWTLLFNQGIEYCTKKGFVELLDRFPKENITINLLRISICHQQFETSNWIIDHISDVNSIEFLGNELKEAINDSNAKYIEGILKFDNNRTFNEFSVDAIVSHAMQYSDLECVTTIYKHYKITNNIEELSNLALFYGRFDVVDWLSLISAKIKWSDRYYWLYAHKCVFKITSLFNISKSHRTFCIFNFICLSTIFGIFMLYCFIINNIFALIMLLNFYMIYLYYITYLHER